MKRIIGLFFLLWMTAVWTCSSGWAKSIAMPWKNITIDGQKMTVYCMVENGDGQLWLGTGLGVYHFSENGIWHIGNDDLSRCRINAIVPQQERLFVGTNAGLLVYSFAQKSFTQIHHSFGEVRALLLCGDTLWVGSNSGVYRCLISDSHYPLTCCSTGLPSNSVYCLLRDSRGDLYAGTYNGLACWNSNTSCFELLMPEPVDAISSFVNAVIESPDRQSLLVGIHESLYRYAPETEQWMQLPVEGTMCIKCLATMGEEVLFGRSDGLYILEGDKVTVYRHDGNDEHAISDNAIWSITTDAKGRIYAGHGSGLSVSGDGRDMFVIPLSELLGKGTGGEIHAILRDRKGSLWFGGSNGVIKVESGKSKVESTRISHLLPDVMVRAVYEDDEGQIWLATDDGLKRYQPQEDDFVTYYITDQEGNHEAVWVYAVVEDATNLFVGSYLGGLHRVAKSRLTDQGGKVVADASYNTSNSIMPNDFVRTIVRADAVYWVQYWETDQVTRIAPDGTFTTMEANDMPSKPSPPQGYFCAYHDPVTHSTFYGGTDEIVEIGSDALRTFVKQYQRLHSPYRSWWAITLYVFFALLIGGNFIWFTYKKRHTLKTAEELQKALTHVKQRLTKTKDFIVPESTAEKQLVLIVKTVDEHSSDSELNVNALSEKTGIGVKQLYRIVKKEMNMSPLEYINSIRLNKAAKMLAEHKFSVSEVCYKTGFSTPSYFTKCFQKKYGCKPSEY